MIQGQTKTEANYRAINLDSSSSLKEFSTDRKKYYRKYILGESVDDKDTVAATTGRIVETMLLEPNEFDNRFYMSVCLSAPTGLMLAFVEALYKFTKEATDEQGNITRSFEEIAKDAYAESGFKIKFDAVINKFVGSDAEIFYNEMRTVKEKGLTVVTTEDVTNAEKIVEELRTNNVTAEVVNLVSSARYTVHNQLQIENYEVDGLMFKSMMDKVYLYYRAAHTLRDGELTGYDVLPPRFIVCDSTNYYNPLIYTLDYGNIEEAYSGFHHKNREYTGVKYLIEDLKWALENNVWNISRENHKQNGVVRLKIQDGAKENNN